MTGDKITEFSSLLYKSVSAGSLKNVVFHSPDSNSGGKLKAKGVLKEIGGNRVLQIETSLTEGRVSQENVLPDDIAAKTAEYFDIYKKADLTDGGGTVSVMISKKGTVTLLKKGNIGTAEAAAAVSHSAGEGGNDREKNRLLDGSEPFLFELGISDRSGRVHDKMQGKFRQICRFSEYIAEAEGSLPRDGVLHVYDLCCGKSYLSFAAYYVLTEKLGRKVRMICADLKQSVMDYCAQTAKKCGMAAEKDGDGCGMEFICTDINLLEPECQPDLVISLHACDIATDIVLSFAIKHRAKAVLSTPCCQHDLSENLNCPTLDFIASRPILRQKFCAAATDALRLLRLDAAGYRTDATELTDPEDTPKNVMLRGYLRRGFRADSADAQAKKQKYYDTYKFLYGHSPEGTGME